MAQKIEKKAVDIVAGSCDNSLDAGKSVSPESPGDDSQQSSDFYGSPKSESEQLHFDLATIERHKLHWLWKETLRQLQRYAIRADEGVDLQAAMDFARWVQFSGLIRLFKDNPQSDPLRVDWREIDSWVRTLIMDCGDYLRFNTPGFVRVSQIEAVNHKLDLLAAQLAKISPPEKETEALGTAPLSLHVITGGGK